MASLGGMHVGDDLKWSRASFRIFGETLQPEEIGVALGIAATRSHLKGELRDARHTAVWRESAWLLRSPLARGTDLAEHLKWLLEAIESKTDVIAELSKKYRIDFFCGFSSGNGQGGFALDSDILRRIANFGIPLNLDLYPPAIESDDIDSDGNN
ncbi:MAG: DUF4279 domain-containing protein [Candidatus Sulfotelmatobacter sp.]